MWLPIPYTPIMPTGSSVQDMEYPHPLCAREERQKMSQVPRSELSKATLLARKNKGKEQEAGNPADFLRNTYGKRHTDA